VGFSLPLSRDAFYIDGEWDDAALGESMTTNAATRSAAGKLAILIREQVLAMDDGEFLGSQEDLLSRYGVNVLTLRQAMVALINEQLVTSRRGVGGGFFVRRPHAEVVTHIVALYLRSRGVALSEQVATMMPVRMEIARRAAWSDDTKLREELIRFLRKDKDASVAASFSEFNAVERQFNRLLARMSGSTILMLFLEILLDLSHMLYREGDVDLSRGRRVRRQHRIARKISHRAKPHRAGGAGPRRDRRRAACAAVFRPDLGLPVGRATGPDPCRKQCRTVAQRDVC
jgi:DNA-binding FadR family transcriptional regulator